MTKTPHHICSVMIELKVFLEESLNQKNKILRKDIEKLVESMELAQKNKEVECIEETKNDTQDSLDNNQYFT